MLEWRLRPANEDPQLARTFLHGHVALTGSGKHEAHDPHGEGRRNQREDLTTTGLLLPLFTQLDSKGFFGS